MKQITTKFDKCCDCEYYKSKTCPKITNDFVLNRKQFSSIHPDCPLDDVVDKPVSCEICGCTGNSSCGHEPMDKINLCTFKYGVCPCCNIKEATQ